jgi:N6-adenosine-specific RNA methylase IME4
VTRRSVSNLSELVATGEKFGTIYADPPWQYRKSFGRASAAKHYKGTMSIDELCALPVGELAADNAHLHLWTTTSFIMESRRVIEAWGFKFIEAFHWNKPQMGCGNYWRISTEHLMTCSRDGTISPHPDGPPDYIIHPRGKHSAKPEKVRDLIERGSPGPYLELFGRRRVDGWTVFGNQIEDDLLDGAAA